MDIIRGWQRFEREAKTSVDINTVVMRLRPSETTQCNTPESGANLYDVTRARPSAETIKEPMEGERGERKASPRAILGDAGSDIDDNTISRRESLSNHNF